MEKKLKDGKALFEEAIGYQVEGIEEPAKRLESWRKAYDCAEEGAKMGSAECIYLLGVFHVKEVGCRQDFDKAFAYIKQSADMGYFDFVIVWHDRPRGGAVEVAGKIIFGVGR